MVGCAWPQPFRLHLLPSAADVGVCAGGARQDRRLGDKTVLCTDPEPLGRIIIGAQLCPAAEHWVGQAENSLGQGVVRPIAWLQPTAATSAHMPAGHLNPPSCALHSPQSLLVVACME